VSPKLLAVKDLDLAIPGKLSFDHSGFRMLLILSTSGTYTTGKRIVKISSFGPTSEVFTSKQRPRKLKIKGSDGRDYNFLLKGSFISFLVRRLMSAEIGVIYVKVTRIYVRMNGSCNYSVS
jgi:hypothetical protein